MTSDRLPTICLTSNRYVHLVPPFAWCWRHYWPEFHQDDMAVVHYDTLPPIEHSEGWMKLCLGKQGDYTWSSGLMFALEDTPEEHVLLVLEDYWLSQPAMHHAIMQAATLMRSNPRIGKIDLSGDRVNFPHIDSEYPDYVQAVTRHTAYSEAGGFRNRLYLMSYQAAIWRVDFLLDHLRPNEDPWESEERGTVRLLDTGMLILGHRAAPLKYTQAVKAGKPDLLRVERFDPHFLEQLSQEGLLTPWGM